MPPVIVAAALTAGTVIYTTHQQKKASEKATKAAERQAEKERNFREQQGTQELQAGEYFEELNVKQMELQAQTSNIITLANLIASLKEQQPAPKVFTLPAAKTYSPAQQINQAIDRLLRG